MYMIEIFLAILIGCIIGLFTGLTPGVHINLIATISFSLSGIILNVFPVHFVVIALISMAIVHTFLDIIPTAFLGLPSEDSIVEALPAHKLTMEGKAKEVIMVSALGALGGLIIIIALSPFILKYVKYFYDIINPFIAYILIWVSFMIIYFSKNKLFSFFIFILSGFFGFIVLNTKVLNQPLLPLLSGLFGVSSLLLSINFKTIIPKQIKKVEVKIGELNFFRNLSSGVISCLLTSFLPGLTSSHTTIIAGFITKVKTSIDYLIINGCIGTVSMFVSLIALYSLGKSRNGVIIAISNFSSINQQLLWILIFSTLISSFVALFLLFKFSDLMINIMEMVSYKFLCIAIITFVTLLVLILSGWLGIVVLISSTAIGIIPQITNVERLHLMGVLLIPVIIFL